MLHGHIADDRMHEHKSKPKVNLRDVIMLSAFVLDRQFYYAQYVSLNVTCFGALDCLHAGRAGPLHTCCGGGATARDLKLSAVTVTVTVTVT